MLLRDIMALKFIIRHESLMHQIIIIMILSITSTCIAAGIRSPPPLKLLTAASVGCSGSLQGWLWDRCLLDDAVVWTAIAFGHHAITYMVFPPRGAIGGHIQYSPFTAERPFIINFNENSDADSKTFHLPPAVVSVYIQSNLQQQTFWNPKMTLRMTSIDDADRGKFEFSEMWVRSAFNCDCNDTVTYAGPGEQVPGVEGVVAGDGVLKFSSNTEYMADNIIFVGHRGIFAEVTASAVYWVNIQAFLAPHTLMPAGSHILPPSETDSSVLWSLDFAVANDEPITPKAQQKHFAVSNDDSGAQQEQPSEPPSQLLHSKRFHASSVSHKMCESPGHHGSHPLQNYNPQTKILSVWFHNGTQNMSMHIISASVSHDRRGFADLELLVWFEAESRCNCHDNFLCNASPVTNFLLSCSVRGLSVQARHETQQYAMNGNQRESVISCRFKSSALSLSDGIASVLIADPVAKIHAVVALCPLPPDRRIHRIVACAQPMCAPHAACISAFHVL
jgi:hypothetical protein